MCVCLQVKKLRSFDVCVCVLRYFHQSEHCENIRRTSSFTFSWPKWHVRRIYRTYLAISRAIFTQILTKNSHVWTKFQWYGNIDENLLSSKYRTIEFCRNLTKFALITFEYQQFSDNERNRDQKPSVRWFLRQQNEAFSHCVNLQLWATMSRTESFSVSCHRVKNSD